MSRGLNTVKLHEGIEFYRLDDADEFEVEYIEQKGDSTLLHLADGETLWVSTDNIKDYVTGGNA